VAESDALVDRLRRNDAGDQALRKAFSVLGPLVRDLPSTDDLLLTDESRRAFQTLRDAHPEIYLVYRSAVRQRAGRHVTDLLDHYIGPPGPWPRREISLLTIADLMTQPAVEWGIAQILPTRGLGVVIGSPGSGKSFFAQDAGFAVATGRPFFGRETKSGRVLFVVSEGRAKDRVAAYLQNGSLDVAALGVRFIEQSLDLCGATSDLERVEAIVRDFRPALVVIDTLARVAGGGDENSSSDMGRLLASFKRLEDAGECMVLIIHHVGKDASRGARGHSSLLAAADVEIEILNDAGLRTARITKLRDGRAGDEFCFRLEPVVLAGGGSSCVVVATSEVPKPRRAERQLTPNERVCVEALREELATSGERLPATSTIPAGQIGVKVEAWRNRFYARLGETLESAARRQAFHRGKAGLLSRQSIECWQEWVWERRS
jgi:archaellum biogenesis ATPase FlaH